MPDALRQRLLHVSREFFRTRPLGTSFDDAELNAYRQRLREVVREWREAAP